MSNLLMSGNWEVWGTPVLWPFWVILVVWTLLWKAWALWIAARKGEKVWFGFLLVLNTMGILEIIYIYIINKAADRKK